MKLFELTQSKLYVSVNLEQVRLACSNYRSNSNKLVEIRLKLGYLERFDQNDHKETLIINLS